MDYTFQILDGGTVIFNGYFTVVGGKITAFYDSSLNNQNVLLPKDDFIYDQADNLFVRNTFTAKGVNIYSSSIQSRLNAQSNHLNLFTDTITTNPDDPDRQASIWYIPTNRPFNEGENFYVTFKINKIPRFWMGSLFTNNAQVYYKPHSFSSGGSVTNSRAKKRRT